MFNKLVLPKINESAVAGEDTQVLTRVSLSENVREELCEKSTTNLVCCSSGVGYFKVIIALNFVKLN